MDHSCGIDQLEGSSLKRIHSKLFQILIYNVLLSILTWIIYRVKSTQSYVFNRHKSHFINNG